MIRLRLFIYCVGSCTDFQSDTTGEKSGTRSVCVIHLGMQYIIRVQARV